MQGFKTLNTHYKSNKPLLIIVVVYILISLLGMIFTPLFDEDEGFFAEAARQMLASNNWVSISVNGETRYDKPALFFWCIAVSLKLFGNNEFSARLPSFLFYLLFITQIYYFVKSYYNHKRAQLAVLIAMSLLQFRVLSAAAVSDNLLNLLVASSLIRFYSYMHAPKKRDLFWLYTWAGLAFLTKGPLAFIIIFGVILIFLILTRKVNLFSKLLYLPFIIWALAIPLPWFYLAFIKSGEFLFYDFFWKHNFGRYTSTMESHGGYWWYYLPVLFIAVVPFSHLFFKKISFNKISELNLLLLIWFLLPLLLFSFSKTQLPHYISIGYFSLIVVFSGSLSSKPLYVYGQTVGIILLFLLAPFCINYISISDVYVSEMLTNIYQVYGIYYFSAMGIFLVLTIMVYFKTRYKLELIVCIYFAATTLFFNRYGVLQQGFVKEVGLYLKKENRKVFMLDHYSPSLSFYSERVFTIKNNPGKRDLYFIKYKPKYNSKQHKILKKVDGYLLLEFR